MQRVGSLINIPQLLLSFGVEPNAVVADAGIEPSALRSAESIISFQSMGRLLHCCVVATQCDHFGLLVGRSGTLTTMGLLGRLMQNAPTVGQALQDLISHQHRDARGDVRYLAVCDRTANLGHAVYEKGVGALSQIYDSSVAQLFNIFVDLSGSRPVDVAFPHAKPADMLPFQKHFKVPLGFDSDYAEITFPVGVLSQPVRGANAVLREILERSVSGHGIMIPVSMSDQVSRLLRMPGTSGSASFEEVASRLEMHPRTLNRRLQDEGTSYRELRNDTRLEVACQLLRNTHLSITQIGLTLDYADSAVFSHAFRRLSGLTPSVWRATAA